MSSEDWCYDSLLTVAEKLRSGQVSPIALTEFMLERIKRLNPRFNCFLTVTPEIARRQAARAEAELRQGRCRGPLHGVPVAVKDLCFTQGIPTTGGMSFRKHFKPDADATVVRRLRDAGAVLLGKLHLAEGASVDHDPTFGNPVNPWRDDLWTGSSSSGSGVALAAGLCFAAVGSDTAGSIRFPSAQHGLTGLMPTRGRVSRYGVFDFAPTYDTLGPMARSAADVAATIGVIAGHDPLDPTSLLDPVPDYLSALGGMESLRGVRIGIDRNYNGDGAEKRIIELLEDAVRVFESMGAEIKPIIFPDPLPMLRHTWEVQMAELAAVHARTYPAMADRYGPRITHGLESGLRINPLDYARTVIERDRFSGLLRLTLQEVDALIMPIASFQSVTWSELEHHLEAQTDHSRVRMQRFTTPFNASGNPTVTFAAGFSEEDRPFGIQLIGAHLSEARLLRFVHSYQAATNWHLRWSRGATSNSLGRVRIIQA
ncbi:amidase [Bradyrhizobium murdochi]|uniref:amidase n=1 Tax=Bradyrhizobium murdochi TaxID=1038859 RepID=UPI0007C7A928